MGRIPIPGYLIGKADNEVKKPFPFKLYHHGPCRVWYFSAESEQERERWIKIFTEHLHGLYAKGVSKPDESEQIVDAENVDWSALDSVTSLKELRRFEKNIELEQEDIRLEEVNT